VQIVCIISVRLPSPAYQHPILQARCASASLATPSKHIGNPTKMLYRMALSRVHTSATAQQLHLIQSTPIENLIHETTQKHSRKSCVKLTGQTGNHVPWTCLFQDPQQCITTTHTETVHRQSPLGSLPSLSDH